ncbi:hypothetical protein [Microbispora sitophila]|uniref:hypothetical protein n=1 Tax=Microbispora sitophila TaxID=2771537 RepID=UPI001D02AFF4|nr:hypothetical protein [Microbispora sitophila]
MVSQTPRQGFGPKGFASVAHRLVVPGAGVAAARQVFRLVAATIAASIMPHAAERPA